MPKLTKRVVDVATCPPDKNKAIVWDGETVPASVQASDGVFAGGKFHPCGGGPSGVELLNESAPARPTGAGGQSA